MTAPSAPPGRAEQADAEPSPLPELRAMALEARVALVAGPPGVGKSLWVRRLAALARDGGRRVHLLQWDVTRAAFQTPPHLARYPEVGGVTHAVIRRAVGLWARQAVGAWHEGHPGTEDLLLAEVPLVGGRLVELVQVHDDPVEALLAGPSTRAMAPVPSRAVRTHIEAARQASMAAPRNPREREDAPPDVLTASWWEIHAVAVALGLGPRTADGGERPAYDPDVVRAVYAHLLRHRQATTPSVDERFPVEGSVYDVGPVASELAATPEQVEAVYRRLESTATVAEIERVAAAWATT
jgi:hypothetical protein